MAFAPNTEPAPALTTPPENRYLRRACHAMANWYDASPVKVDSRSCYNDGLWKVLGECDSTFKVRRLGYLNIWTRLRDIGDELQACLSQQLHPLDLLKVAGCIVSWTKYSRDRDLVEPVVTLMSRLSSDRYGMEHPLPLLCGLLNDRSSLAQLFDANFALAERQYFPRLAMEDSARFKFLDHYSRALVQQDRYTEALECISTRNAGHEVLLTVACCKRKQGLLEAASSALGAAWDDVVDRGQELSAAALAVLDASAYFCYRAEELDTAADFWEERLRVLFSMMDHNEMEVLYTVRRLEQMYRKGGKLQEIEWLMQSYPAAFE